MTKKLPPWIKGKSNGTLYVDTSNVEWQKRIIEQIRKYSKLNILNRQ